MAVLRGTTAIPWEGTAEVRKLDVEKVAVWKGVRWWWKVKISWIWYQVWRMINPDSTFT